MLTQFCIYKCITYRSSVWWKHPPLRKSLWYLRPPSRSLGKLFCESLAKGFATRVSAAVRHLCRRLCGRPSWRACWRRRERLLERFSEVFGKIWMNTYIHMNIYKKIKIYILIVCEESTAILINQTIGNERRARERSELRAKLSVECPTQIGRFIFQSRLAWQSPQTLDVTPCNREGLHLTRFPFPF